MHQSTTLPGHVDYLDGWRGLAIALLLIGHFFPVPGLDFGIVGVNLFFVLSGYLMGQLLFLRQQPLATFYRRRIARIVPAHAFFIVAIVLVYALAGRDIHWGETFAALFFFNNYYFAELGHPAMPFGHIWSLSVEEHSYMLLSGVALAARHHLVDARWAVGAIALIFAAIGTWYWLHYTGAELDFRMLLHTEVAGFGIFASCTLLLLFATRHIRSLPWLAYPLLFWVGVLAHWWSVPSPLRIVVGLCAFALLVNMLVSAPPTIKAALSIRPLRMLGLWSFSIYLWQQPFYFAVHREGMPSYLGCALAIIAGTLSYYGLERPARSYLNRTWGTTVKT